MDAAGPLLGRDLTALARAGQLDPVVGREKELDQVLRILCRRTKNNPLLLGEPGVGKTALAEGLAQLIAAGNAPPSLRGRTLFELQLGSLLAGTQYRGDLEGRVQEFLRGARETRLVVFIDELHLLVVAGRGSGMDVANLLKPILSRGEIPCLGATTPAEAAEMFRVDPAMQRRFQPVVVAEPDRAGVEAVLRAARPRLEAHHGLVIADEAITAAVAHSESSPSVRKNPDRALDLLEDACSSVQLAVSRAAAHGLETSPELHDLRAELSAATESLDLGRHLRVREALEAAHARHTTGLITRLAPDARVDARHVQAVSDGP